ncbi:hypothetical protein GRI38_08475 [Altererythrobacter aurantiacus]|uniref:Rhamnogalacturonase A/B/Epimerase-like pectate lyase domain-containing protein n=1 Tax=Parapontixanthobacter aurantiacus TaxID=1463599 RepID=A0A844ZBY3_9SPHN|nr:hypothetical protein [Parapontixanthobacter aurantiacus]
MVRWFAPVLMMLSGTFVAAQERPVSVLDFGAVPGDGRADDEAIVAALRYARDRGFNEVVLPQGEYLIAAQMSYVSGVDLVGAGCGRTVLKRSAGSRGQMMFELDGTSDASLRGMTFEYSGAPEFYRAIGFRGAGSQNIVIERNCFSDRNPTGVGGDRWAVELSAEDSPSRNVTISNNEVRGRLQLTAGGGAGVSRLRLSENTVIGATANGIGLSTLSDSAVFDDIEIRDNDIRNSSSIGIFIGPDQPYADGGKFNNIRIIDNRIDGLTSRFGYGIFLRASRNGFSQVSINGNSLDGGAAEKTTAIRLTDDHGKGQRNFSGVRICQNDARRFSRGLWLENVDTAAIDGNRVDTGRPYLVEPSVNHDVRFDSAGGC